MRRAILVVTISAALGLAPGGMTADLWAQGPAPPDSLPTVLQRYPEVVQAQLDLMRLLSQAFEADPVLDTLRLAFETAQEDAMVALDPATPRRRARMAELGVLHDQLVATEESPDVDAMLQEGRELRRSLLATAAEARQQPDVATSADTLAAVLQQRFEVLDPDAFRRLSQYDQWIEMVWAVLLVSP